MVGLFLRASKSVVTGSLVFSKIQAPLTLSARRSMALQWSQWPMVLSPLRMVLACWPSLALATELVIWSA